MEYGFRSFHPSIRWVSLFVSLGLFTFLLFYTVILSCDVNCADPEEIIIIPKGASVHYTANILHSQQCLSLADMSTFKLAMQATFNEGNIIPGRYNLKGIVTIGDLINLITTPSRDRVKVTLLEGWTIEEIADELNRTLEIDTFKFISLCKDYNFVHSLNIDAPSIEGFLFPDTYIFVTSYTEEQIINIMVNQFFHNYDKHIRKKIKHTTLSLREVATMASIIQGEAVFDDEMPTISSVYHNRIRRKMLLQADPTIQYIIPGKNRRLYNKDLKVDSPYNTYKYKGLPPGPINNPGLPALIAAVEPAESKYLYFVADGEGRHIFSQTNDEHNQAKHVLRKKRREIRKNK